MCFYALVLYIKELSNTFLPVLLLKTNFLGFIFSNSATVKMSSPDAKFTGLNQHRGSFLENFPNYRVNVLIFEAPSNFFIL
jgi:hypothetical protein